MLFITEKMKMNPGIPVTKTMDIQFNLTRFKLNSNKHYIYFCPNFETIILSTTLLKWSAVPHHFHTAMEDVAYFIVLANAST